LQEYRQALQLYPRSANALTGEATTYEKMGRIADAEQTLLKAAAMRPDYWDGYNSLGVFYDRQSKFPQAIQEYQTAEKLTPDNAMVYSNLGAAYIDGGDPKDFPKAEEALKKAIDINPSYFAYSNLAFVYLNEKRYEESVAMSQKALQLNDKDYLVWANLMSAYEGLHEKDKAEDTREHIISLLEDQLKRNPQDPVKQASLAELYAHKGEREKAMARIHTALAGAPDDPNVLELTGETYENLGDRHQAISYVQKALKKGYPLDQLKDDPDLENLLSDPSFRPQGK
jgi:eukaryotic-like serine/threonine-protein kinase